MVTFVLTVVLYCSAQCGHMSPMMAMLGKFKNTHAYRTLKEYSECATVHGISYIFEKVEHATTKFAIYLCSSCHHKICGLTY